MRTKKAWGKEYISIKLKNVKYFIESDTIPFASEIWSWYIVIPRTISKIAEKYKSTIYQNLWVAGGDNQSVPNFILRWQKCSQVDCSDGCVYHWIVFFIF